MKKSSQISLFLALTCLISGGVVIGQENDGEKKAGKPRPPVDSKSHHTDRNPMKDLTEDERVRLRSAMSEIWSNPAVVQSREGVNESVKAYKSAIQAAILKQDPKLAGVLKKMSAGMDRHRHDIMGRGKGGKSFGDKRGGETRGFEMMTRRPPSLDGATDAQKKKYFAVRDQLMKTPEFGGFMEKLRGLRKRDEETRHDRTKILNDLHKALRKKIQESDPELAKLLGKSEGKKDGSRGPKRPPVSDKK